jgi:chitodextrinase
MPNTLALLNANRPMGYDGTRQTAWETLTHAGVGSGTCTPLTQQQACGSQTCGTASDGCGATVSCGTCGSGQTCNGTTCVTTCTPATCSSLGDSCGSPSDGCGGTLSCGPCPTAQYCGLGGTANHCAADTTPPSVPTGLGASNLTTTAVTVVWNTSTDDVGVTGYNVYRDGNFLGTATADHYNDSGLTTGRTYSYTVSAYDAVPNYSVQSAALSVTPALDTTPPSVPTGLVATGATSSSITLDWVASTDADSDCTGYNVYRDGTQVGTSATTGYTDTGLTAGTSHSYTVAAYDNLNNTSAQCSAVNASTTSATGCTVSGNTFASGTPGSGTITYKDTAAETNPTIKFTLPSGETYSSTGCHLNHQSPPYTTTTLPSSITAITCSVSGQTVTYNFTGTLAANTSLALYYSTSTASPAAATNVIANGNTCH